MPLPPTLQARLMKRGILQKQLQDTQPEEEIIAEDYADKRKEPVAPLPIVPPTPPPVKEVVIPPPPANVIPEVRLMRKRFDVTPTGAPGCPNKWNIFHECSDFCYNHWADGIKEPSAENERKRLKMMKKYPLPPHWEEMYDKGTGRYYYWNTSNDDVSWLPPHHPRAKVSMAAAKLREITKHKIGKQAWEGERLATKKVDEDQPAEKESRLEEHRKERRRAHDRERYKGRPMRKENDIDPMDPAAYSEAPRGNWSTGLERKGEAKTGADTTASGPLYQMRPYPSPGAVLRANAEMKGKPDTKE